MSLNENPEASSSKPLIGLYDKASQKWQATVDRLGYPAAYAELVSKGLGGNDNRPAAKVLDVGTGSGAFAAALLKTQRPIEHIDLLDPSAEMLAVAQSQIRPLVDNTTAILGEVGSPDIAKSTYDIVLCAHVIEHIDDVAGGLAWMKSLSKPTGVLLIAVSKPHWCTTLIRLRWGHAAFSPKRAAELLRNAGFSQVETVPFSNGPPSRTSCGFIARP